MNKKNSRIKIDDIAKMAGVSKGAVSYVLNNKPGVSKEVRERILQIIKEYNYKPNKLAQALAGKKTNFVALVIPDISDMFYARIIKGVEETLSKHGYYLNLYSTHANPEREHQVFDFLDTGIVDGVIVIAYHIKKDFVEKIAEKEIPFVFIDYPYESEKIYSVLVDNEEGGFQATEYLISLGHKKIAFIHGSKDAWDSFARFNGYLKALEKYNIPFNERLVKRGDFTKEGGYKAVKELIESGEDFSAIFSANDHMAFGAIKALKEKRLKIPRDVSIIGFDNIEASALSSPPLTTIMQPIMQVGKKAAEILIKILSGDPPKQKKYLLKTQLIERKSCRKI
ncbi:MAG: LacI family DNA-binding transcriptional regulator [Dictyoglomaceae bacterium]